jgi:hypothetical protein
MPGLELTQLKFTDDGEPDALNVGTTVPSVTVVSGLEFASGKGFTVTDNEAVGSAHCPLAVVNVYIPDAVLLIADGLQLPEIPFEDVAGKDGGVLPWQRFKLVPKLNDGVTTGFTVTVNVAGAMHCPGKTTGVNVYTPDAVLLTIAGFHVPLMPLSEVTGNNGTLLPAHMLSVVPKLNAGIVFAFTVTVNVVVFAHCPADGVKV